MFMRSERLFLRPGWPEDWEEVLSQIADETVLPGLPETMADPRLPQFLITLPTLAGPAPVIGWVALTRQADALVLAFWIARQHRRQGYATEAGKAVLRVAATLGHRRIIAHHFADNPASARVLRKLGFCATGQVGARHSPLRGESALAAEYAAVLDGPCDCDDDPAMRRAA